MKLYGFTGAARTGLEKMSERKGFALAIRGNEIFDCFLFENVEDAVEAKLYAKRNGFITGDGYVIREADGDSLENYTVLDDSAMCALLEEERLEKLPLTEKIPERETLEWALYVQNHYKTDFFKPEDLFRAGQIVERFNIKNKIYELVSGAFH